MWEALPESTQRMSDKNVANPTVYKKEELTLMIELIEAGLWGSSNLANALHIDRSTVERWKETPEVQEAHRRAIMKFLRKRQDVEKILGELKVETPAETPKTLIQVNYQPIFGGKSVKELPEDS